LKVDLEILENCVGYFQLRIMPQDKKEKCGLKQNKKLKFSLAE
jgi:hypothetical protein